MLVLIRHGVKEVLNFKELGEFNILNIFINGWLGVDLFFVISGFLITHHLLRNWQQTSFGRQTFLLRYFSKRILRTFPTYYFILALYLLGLLPNFSEALHNSWNILIIHLLFMQDMTGNVILPSLWSIAVEEKFYIIAPTALFLISRIQSHKKKILLICSLSVLPLIFRLLNYNGNFNDHQFFYVVRAPFLQSIDGIILGGIIAYLNFKDIKPQKLFLKKRPLIVNFLFFKIVCILYYKVYLLGDLMDVYLLFLLPLLFSLILFFGLDLKKSLFQNKFMFFFSNISYSLYLVHMTIIPFSLDITNSTGGFLFLYFLMSVSLSTLIHLTIEKPFIILKNRIDL